MFFSNAASSKLDLKDNQIISTQETYFIEMTQTVKKVHVEVHHGKPDVSVSVTSSDLSSILEGSLAPLQAYLTGLAILFLPRKNQNLLGGWINVKPDLGILLVVCGS